MAIGEDDIRAAGMKAEDLIIWAAVLGQLPASGVS
jgi:hypothetical protein